VISAPPGYAADCKGVFGCDAKYRAAELLVSYGFGACSHLQVSGVKWNLEPA